MNFTVISCAAAKKLFKEGQPFYACPCKLRPDGPFSSAALILSGAEWLERAGWKEGAEVGLYDEFLKAKVEKSAWELFVNNWKYYNASWEAGYYPTYYVAN